MKKIAHMLFVFGFVNLFLFNYAIAEDYSVHIEGCPYKFTKDLYAGVNDNDVLILQRILNSDRRTVIALNGPGSIDNETKFFGDSTKIALKRFQALFIEFIGVANGVFDERTLNVAQAICDGEGEKYMSGNYISGTEDYSSDPSVISSTNNGEDISVRLASNLAQTKSDTFRVSIYLNKPVSNLTAQSISVEGGSVTEVRKIKSTEYLAVITSDGSSKIVSVLIEADKISGDDGGTNLTSSNEVRVLVSSNGTMSTIGTDQTLSGSLTDILSGLNNGQNTSVQTQTQTTPVSNSSLLPSSASPTVPPTSPFSLGSIGSVLGGLLGGKGNPLSSMLNDSKSPKGGDGLTRTPSVPDRPVTERPTPEVSPTDRSPTAKPALSVEKKGELAAKYEKDLADYDAKYEASKKYVDKCASNPSLCNEKDLEVAKNNLDKIPEYKKQLAEKYEKESGFPKDPDRITDPKELASEYKKIDEYFKEPVEKANQFLEACKATPPPSTCTPENIATATNVQRTKEILEEKFGDRCKDIKDCDLSKTETPTPTPTDLPPEANYLSQSCKGKRIIAVGFWGDTGKTAVPGLQKAVDKCKGKLFAPRGVGTNDAKEYVLSKKPVVGEAGVVITGFSSGANEARRFAIELIKEGIPVCGVLVADIDSGTNMSGVKVPPGGIVALKSADYRAAPTGAKVEYYDGKDASKEKLLHNGGNQITSKLEKYMPCSGEPAK